MKKFIGVLLSMVVLLSGVSTYSYSVPVYAEQLERGLAAVCSDEGVFISWRLLPDEVGCTDFILKRNARQIAYITESTNYFDANGKAVTGEQVIVFLIFRSESGVHGGSTGELFQNSNVVKAGFALDALGFRIDLAVSIDPQFDFLHSKNPFFDGKSPPFMILLLYRRRREKSIEMAKQGGEMSFSGSR